VISAIFFMKIFEKAGVEGKWRAWVPVYNTLIFAKLGDVSPWAVLIAWALSFIPYLNFLTGIALVVLLALAAWRVGLKLQKDAIWVVLYIFLSLIWLGINAFDKSRWNPSIAPAPWAANSFLADSTVWQGVPVQPRPAAPAPGYGAPQGYAPPAPQGYAPPAQPGYAPPAQPGYTQPAPPAQPGYAPPVAPATGAPVPPAPQTPPAAPQTPPAPPAAPPAAPTAPPAAPSDPTQPPA
jgi:hypothetical protein